MAERGTNGSVDTELRVIPGDARNSGGKLRAASFQKSAREAVVGEIFSFRNREFFQLRIIAFGPGGTEIFTPRGITLGIEHLPALEAAVRALREAAERGAFEAMRAEGSGR